MSAFFDARMRAFGRVVFAGTLTAAVAWPAAAQEAATDDDLLDVINLPQVETLDAGAVSAAGAGEVAAQAPNLVEEIVVTGSRIARDEFSSSSPISTFDSEDLINSGLAGVDEFLKDVPAFTGFQLGASTNNGAEQGQKKIDLRGLEFKRTLVLINGRRQVGDANSDGAVDLNTIPDAMIKRVEVLKDGASTVYGSDALAGVVNIILKDDFEGVEFSANYGQGLDDGQAANEGLSMLAGMQGSNGGYMLFSAGYSNQIEMKQAERPFAVAALYPLLTDVNGTPDNTADDVYQLTPSGSSNSRRIRVDSDQDGAYESSFIVDADSGQARSFGPGDVYNYAPVNALITPNERYQMGAIGSFPLMNFAELYTEMLYTRRTSQQRLAPDASFAVTTVQTPNNGTQMNDYVPTSNPFNPFGDNPRNDEGISGQDVRINRRFVESGGRLFGQSADTYRLATGLRGTIMDGIDWDFSMIVAEAETIDQTSNYGRFDRWAIAVDPDACAADNACTAAGGVLNPFDDFGSISQSQMGYLTAGPLKDVYKSRLEMTSLYLSGEAFELAGGAMGWAAGLEHRHESGSFTPDEFLAEGLTTGGASDPLSGSFTAQEAYGEVYLPVLDSLSVDASLRFSDYNTTSSSLTYKLGVDYAALDSLRIRSGISTGFRAPNIAEINQGDQTDFPVVDPVCEFGDRRLASGDITQVAYDNCQALGIDTTDSGEYGFAWQSLYTVSAPSERLDPEESQTLTLGFVYTPDFLGDLALSLDIWDITVDNLIGVDDINDLTRVCMNSPNLTADACSAFSGGAPYSGPFPSDATGELANLGKLTTRGADFNVDFNSDLELWGFTSYRLNFAGTYVDTYERAFPLAGTRDLVGTANGFAVFPEWRFNTDVTLYALDWTLNWGMRYIGETTDALRPASITADNVAEAMLYHDLSATYVWNNASFAFGINNVLDETPPYFHSAFNANTEPGMYDVIGRRAFGSVKLEF